MDRQTSIEQGTIMAYPQKMGSRDRDESEPVTFSRETLSDQVARWLTDRVARQFQPGDLLPSEASLAKQAGVSRPVVREALKTLAGQGVLQIVSGKGAIVQPVNGRLLQLFFKRAIHASEGNAHRNLMEVRAPLEIQSAMLAAERRSDEEAQAMRKTVEAMRGAFDDIETFADIDLQFHLQVAAATHNAMMEHLVRSVRESLRDMVQEGIRRQAHQERLERVQAMHEAVQQAIQDQDPEGARRAMDTHFEDAVTIFVEDEAG